MFRVFAKIIKNQKKENKNKKKDGDQKKKKKNAVSERN